MTKFKLTLSALMATSILSGSAFAETTLEKVEVKGPTWDTQDTGRNDFDKKRIETYSGPSGDLNNLFRVMPNVQYNRNYLQNLSIGSSTGAYSAQQNYKRSVLDQRPSSISISGGRFYENAYIINGRSASTRLMLNTEENGNSGGSIYDVYRAGWMNRSSQSEWVKPFDVESVKIYDSNIPAKYGKFAGGVVDVKIKKPTGKAGGTFYFETTGSKFEKTIIVGNPKKESLIEDYTAFNTGVRYNTNKYKLKNGNEYYLSFAADLSERETINPLSDSNKKAQKLSDKAKSKQENKTVTATFEMADKTVNVSFTKQDYSIDMLPNEGHLVEDKQQRDGQSGSVSVKQKLSNGRTVNYSLDYSDNKLNRKGKDNLFNWEGTTTAKWNENCGTLSASDYDTCITGGYGSAYERERNVNLNASYTIPTKFGDVEVGGNVNHADLRFNRAKDSTKYDNATNYAGYNESGKEEIGEVDTWFYLSGGKWLDGENDEEVSNSNASSYYRNKLDATTLGNLDKVKYRGSSVVCETEDESCKTGDFAYGYRERHLAKDVKKSGFEHGGYVQTTKKTDNGFTIRAGLRYDRDTLLKNNNFAPRFSASHKVKFGGRAWTNTYGLNRYYANSNATYHLLGKEVGKYNVEKRIMRYDASTGKTIWTDTWFKKGGDSGSNYSYDGLKTPYKDEISITTQSPVYKYGQVRLKAVYRDGKDEFSANGANGLENKGSSMYKSLSAEYRNTWGDNLFFANVKWSKTKVSSTDLLTKPDNGKTSNVVYNGKVYKEHEINKMADQYRNPHAINFGYARKFSANKYGNVLVGLTGRYTLKHKRLGKTYFGNGSNADKATVGGRQYDKISKVDYPAQLNLNAKVSWDIYNKGRDTGVNAYITINNLLNKYYKGGSNGKAINTIARGRSFLLGVKVDF
ncbi:MAG: hypothetical protein ACPG8V_05455 [Alphaproteobacteria bacterium]